MSIDLTLLPFLTLSSSCALDVLGLECDLTSSEELLGAIRALPSSEPVEPINSRLGHHESAGCRYYDEKTYGPTPTDAYGDPVRFVWAGELAALAKLPGVTGSPRNVAAFAYIAALPSRWPVALYWS